MNNQKGNLYLIIAIIVGIIAIGAVGFASWKYFGGGSELEKNGNEITKPLIEKETEKAKITDEKVDLSKASATENWKTYKNDEYGFELKYPRNVLVNDKNNNRDQIKLYIVSEKIDNLGTSQPWSLDKETALKDRNAIEKGDASVHFGFEVKNSCKIINIPGALSKEFIILGAFEVCDVQFTKKAFIYKDNYRIRLNWQLGSEEIKKIIENNPNYFTVNSANCGNYKIWKDQDNFYRNLIDGKTDSVSQKWINDFDKIISTFKFIETNEISSIKILSPNGGEKWTIGNNYEIKWKSSLNVEKKVDIYLIKEGKWNLANYIAFSVPNTGVYNWDLTDTEDNLIQPGDKYKIQVFVRKGEPGEFDESNNYFSIKEKSKSESVSIFIDAESFNLVNKSFEGRTQPEGENIKVMTTSSTKLYEGTYDEGKFIVVDNNYYSFSEFYTMLKNWTGPSWPFTVKGTFEKSNIIRADEIFFIAQ